MTDNINELIKEVAVKNGVALSRNDPIMIIQTMHDRFLENCNKEQARILDDYKEELEGIAGRWGYEAKNKAESILNASLKASRETMATLLRDSVKINVDAVRNEIENSLACLNEPVRNVRKVAIINLAASVITFITAAMMILFYLFR
ncbi:conjugal transfer protein TraM [Xenorhabdus bovienii]|uniref:conjugal transfer protein TraM n=1 Tax=Xenorhabdus bovienii TaxID=40576 RepID=UPI003DA5FD89